MTDDKPNVFEEMVDAVGGKGTAERNRKTIASIRRHSTAQRWAQTSFIWIVVLLLACMGIIGVIKFGMWVLS